MKIQSVLVTPKILKRLNTQLNYLNIPLSSNYEIHTFLSDQELGMFQIDSLSRLILKLDGIYLEGDEHRIKELLFDVNEKMELVKKSRKTTLYASLGLAALGIVASYAATSNTKYATVDICFEPEILHSTPRSEFCKSGQTIYRTSPKFLLSKDQSKPNEEFVSDTDKFLIPAKGRKIKNWNKPSNPGYLTLAGIAVLVTSASYWLYSQSNRRYSLEFPEYFGMLKTYTLKNQLKTNQENILAIGQNAYRTQFLNQNSIANAQGLELGFQNNSENLADRQQAIFEENQQQLVKQNILQDRMFELQLSELDKKISENVRDSSKATKEISENNSEDSSGSKKSKAKKPTNEEVKKEGEDIVKACEGFKLGLEYVGSTTAPSIVRHRFKFRKDSQLKKVNDIKKLSEDLALNLGLEHDPRICRDKGEIVVEVPRKDREFPSIFEALEKIKKPSDKQSLLILGGVDINGENLLIDLVNGVDKHLLGSGTTNSGKTRGLYAQIATIVKNYSPDEVKFAIYDGKKSLKIPKEMNPWLFIPTAFATEGEDFLNELENERFNRMESRGDCEDLKEFNSLNPEKKKPFILAIFDEYSVDRELFEGDKPDNNLMKKMAKLCRSEGIHLFAIDQDGKDENISNRVKANLAIRIVYKMVDSKCSEYVGVESAEKLLGFGDVITKVEGIEHRCQMPNCSPEDLKKIVIERVAELGLIQDSKKASGEN
jgi:DNA segregation ATPase FtsK/SpoIIIE-like protein